MTPVQVVRAWFDAFAAGDLDTARQLLSHDALLDPGAGAETTRGFDAFLAFYERKRAAHGPAFAYELHDLLESDDHVVALLTLRDERGSWRQTAVYHVDGPRIAAIYVIEEPH